MPLLAGTRFFRIASSGFPTTSWMARLLLPVRQCREVCSIIGKPRQITGFGLPFNRLSDLLPWCLGGSHGLEILFGFPPAFLSSFVILRRERNRQRGSGRIAHFCLAGHTSGDCAVPDQSSPAWRWLWRRYLLCVSPGWGWQWAFLSPIQSAFSLRPLLLAPMCWCVVSCCCSASWDAVVTR